MNTFWKLEKKMNKYRKGRINSHCRGTLITNKFNCLILNSSSKKKQLYFKFSRCIQILNTIYIILDLAMQISSQRKVWYVKNVITEFSTVWFEQMFLNFHVTFSDWNLVALTVYCYIRWTAAVSKIWILEECYYWPKVFLDNSGFPIRNLFQPFEIQTAWWVPWFL